MKTLKNTVVSLSFLTSLSLAACGGGGDGMAKLNKLKDQACACKDSACAKGVMKELKELKELRGKEAAKPIIKELTACVSDAMMPTP